MDSLPNQSRRPPGSRLSFRRWTGALRPVAARCFPRRRRRGGLLLPLLLAFILSSPLAPFCRAQTDQARPHIGLVLGGGGAKGLAHLGVLQWLEEHRIPVDSIAGTSVGALVGAFYASGRTPQEIQQLARQTDWSKMLASSPPFPAFDFRRKQDRVQLQTHLELGLAEGVSIPRGLSPGHFIELLLQDILLPYFDLESFDQLPIPFACVATNMETGKIEVLREGGLPSALRASMAIPGVFTPVERDGLLLADGGLLNNVPADVSRTLGAEIVISVNVGSPLSGREDLDSILSIINQSIDIMMYQNVERTLRFSDVVIMPDVTGFGTIEFERSQELIRNGYAAAEQKRLLLETFSLTPQEWAEYLDSRRARVRTQIPQPRTLKITGVEATALESIQEELQHHTGKPVAPAALAEDLTDVYGSGRFTRVTYRIEGRPEASRLHVLADRKTYGPPFLRFGLMVDGSELEEVDFGLRARLIFLDALRYGSELRIDGAVGSPLELSAEYYVPLKGHWFVAPRGWTGRSVSDLFSGRNRVAEYEIDQSGVGFDLGYGFGLKHSEVRFGYELSHIGARVRIGNPVLPSFSGRSSSLKLGLIHNQLDHPSVPTDGIYATSQLEYFLHFPGADSPFYRLDSGFSAFSRISLRNTLFVRGRGGTTFNERSPAPLAFTLGGPLLLGAYSRDEIRGSRYFFGGGGYMHRFWEAAPFVGGATYVVAWYEGGTAYDPGEAVDFGHSGSLGVLFQTLAGPLLVGGSWGEAGRGRIYFTIGKSF